ncbi:UNVERIFIED_CONTAM: hypothetical protein Sradi_3583600 [Sesamum radiatum]|uniref:Uncharacterized protein n=1 Tax=Sesamum radiatum TaxID=300843 RepID=A0AAW2QGC6_SESRA
MFSKLIHETMLESRSAATPPNTRSSQGIPSSSDQTGKHPTTAMLGSSSKRPRPSSSNAPPTSSARHTSTLPPPKDSGSGLFKSPRLLLEGCTIIL